MVSLVFLPLSYMFKKCLNNLESLRNNKVEFTVVFFFFEHKIHCCLEVEFYDKSLFSSLVSHSQSNIFQTTDNKNKR